MRMPPSRTSGHPLAGLGVGVPEPKEGVRAHRVHGLAAARGEEGRGARRDLARRARGWSLGGWLNTFMPGARRVSARVAAWPSRRSKPTTGATRRSLGPSRRLPLLSPHPRRMSRRLATALDERPAARRGGRVRSRGSPRRSAPGTAMSDHTRNRCRVPVWGLVRVQPRNRTGARPGAGRRRYPSREASLQLLL